ncbi:MAG: SMC-Scp complex subunit ScpB [Candidatus Sumerlaeota bacterium]|nr:SMC-Scp complex subunit ScpB [Candidatus Sumerlaeota bacterium]
MSDKTDDILEGQPEAEFEHEAVMEGEVGQAQSPAISPEEVRPILECLLFASTEPLSIKQLGRIIPSADAKTLRRVILDLQVEYDQQGRGLQIIEVAGGYQMATHRRFASYILQLNRNKKRSPLSTPALETLAIIAYKQPIIRAEIEAIRGVDSSGVIHSLVELNLVKIVGTKETPGRPPMYGTTEEFLKVFGLKRLSDLPSIRELREQYEKRSESGASEK